MPANNFEENNGSKRRNSDANDGGAPGKRMRNDNESTDNFTQREIRPNVSTKQLSHEDYTICWICALPLEMVAARAMLDEEHMMLPTPVSDHNVYTLGSISSHNVVIACLPAGIYGLTSATAVGLSIRGTFPNSVHMPLMVGIGGGVPSERHDIRLGDVVVSHPSPEQPAVKQYDYGKTTENGRLECKGTLNKPAHGLLNAVASLQAQHGLYTSQISSNISMAFQRYNLSEHRYPGVAEDVLHEPECEHTLEAPTCELCGPLKEVTRLPRQSTMPIIHYGSIASGNQVIKHARTRDRLAQQHDILCFEMESAGLMDYLPCLVIRGISDYCDSYKHKQFQGYAALAAAAYTKELLSIIPVKQPTILTEMPTRNNAENPAQRNDQMLEHCRSIMEALNFEEAETRRDTVRNAHSQTCRWILDRPEYTQWLDPDKFYEHDGLLWIKGKPATGKSTIVKYILKHTEKRRSDNLLVISFFFNARGQDLEKSTLGMYRSLLFQLFSQAGDLQSLLHDIKSGISFVQSDLNLLVRLFKKALGQLRSRKLLCFVDALDECPEDQIREMLDAFVQATDVHFLLCFSSRHYPNITVNDGVQLVLEDQDGHSQDLTNYINSELKIGKNKRAESLKKAIFQKSNGIFLWVVLVIGILKRENDRGRVHNMERRLNEIPIELNDLFKDIILRNGHDLAELVLCIQWILYAQRPLERAEFYFALLSANHDDDLEPWDSEEISIKTMDNYILDCSKGLAELTKAGKPTVQFIHESVREFLLKTDALVDLYPGFRETTKGTSHQKLKECCYRWMNAPVVKTFFLPYQDVQLGPPKSAETTSIREKANSMFPFLVYAAESILFHAEEAQRSQIQQHFFLSNFEWQYWRTVYNTLQRYGTRQLRCPPEMLCFPFYLASLNAQHLLQIYWNHRHLDASFADIIEILLPNLDQVGFITLYKAKFSSTKTLNATHMGQVTTLFTFLKHTVETPYKKQELYFILDLISMWGDDVSKLYFRARHTLVNAARRKHAAVIQLLLDHFNFNEPALNDVLIEVLRPSPLLQENPKNTSIVDSSNNIITPIPDSAVEIISCLSILSDRGLSLETHSVRDPRPALVLAVLWADISVVQFLLERQPLLDSGILDEAFRSSIQVKKLKTAGLLLQRGAQFETYNGNGDTTLHVAVATYHLPTIQFVLDQGANVNRPNRRGSTVLHLACRNAHEEVIYLLINNGAQVNIANIDGITPLHSIAQSLFGCPQLMEKLMEKLIALGAQVNARDNTGDTPLHKAVKESYSTAGIRLLLRFGADINSKNQRNKTPLHYAASNFLEAFLAILIEKGAQVNVRDDDGKTALHILAVTYISESCEPEYAVSLLVQGGADLEATDNHGRTPIHLALYHMCTARWYNEEVGRAIFEHGAKPILGPRTSERDEEWNWMCEFMHKIKSAEQWVSFEEFARDNRLPRLEDRSLGDLQTRLMLVEQQNKKRLLMGRQEMERGYELEIYD